MINTHIFLVGPMGAGKSSVGKSLAKTLKRPFLDLDYEIERRTGADIQWIFDMDGEEGFRDRESKIFSQVIEEKKRAVIATGGGIVLREENRALLNSHGTVIYLFATKEQLIERTKRDKNRPLLQVKDRAEVISEILDQRDPLYREVADIVFKSGLGHVSKTVKKLADTLESH
jgi:shikimate kinase